MLLLLQYGAKVKLNKALARYIAHSGEPLHRNFKFCFHIILALLLKRNEKNSNWTFLKYTYT